MMSSGPAPPLAMVVFTVAAAPAAHPHRLRRTRPMRVPGLAGHPLPAAAGGGGGTQQEFYAGYFAAADESQRVGVNQGKFDGGGAAHYLPPFGEEQPYFMNVVFADPQRLMRLVDQGKSLLRRYPERVRGWDYMNAHVAAIERVLDWQGSFAFAKF